MAPERDVTRLLRAWCDGEKTAEGPLYEAVYDELRRLARLYVRGERPALSMPATALVHEAYLKLVDQRQVRWQNRAHFFAIAAHVMRRLLVDRARARGAVKRGAAITVALEDDDIPTAAQPDLVDLDRALDKLALIDPRQARLVELRFFGGLTVEEAATALDVAAITVKRDWVLARTWLYRELTGSS